MAEYGDQLLQGMLSLLLQCSYLLMSASLCLQHEPCCAIIISVTRKPR